jgi:hypothetical protein
MVASVRHSKVELSWAQPVEGRGRLLLSYTWDLFTECYSLISNTDSIFDEYLSHRRRFYARVRFDSVLRLLLFERLTNRGDSARDRDPLPARWSNGKKDTTSQSRLTHLSFLGIVIFHKAVNDDGQTAKCAHAGDHQSFACSRWNHVGDSGVAFVRTALYFIPDVA